MSKTRKILGLVMAIALVLNVFAVSAFAAQDNPGYENAAEAASYTQAWSLGAPVVNGNAYTIPVILNTNYGVGAISFEIAYNSAVASVAATGAVTLGAGYPYTSGTPLISYNPAFTSGTMLVQILPDTTGLSTLPTVALAAGTVIANITFTYSGTGGTSVSIVNNPKAVTTPQGRLVAGRCLSGDYISSNVYNQIAGQTASVTGTQTIGSAAQPDLAVISGTAGVIDTGRTALAEGATCDGYIYGVEIIDGQSIADVFEATNGGTIEIVANAVGSECGTGTLVKVMNGATVAKTYALVIFGDVNGDGAIDPADGDMISLHDAYMLNTDSYQMEDPLQLIAGDVNGDTYVDPGDADIINLSDAYMYGDNLQFYQSEGIAALMAIA